MPRSNGWLLLYPVWEASRPVNRATKLPRVFGQYVYASSNATPSRARASIRGLVLRLYPYAPRWSARRVSIVMRRTLRRLPAMAGGLGDGAAFGPGQPARSGTRA